jgi:hypothetical protein
LGNFKKNIFIKRRRADLPGNGSPWWILLSRDRAQKYLYVADGLDEVIWTLDRDSGQALSGFGRRVHFSPHHRDEFQRRLVRRRNGRRAQNAKV